MSLFIPSYYGLVHFPPLLTVSSKTDYRSIKSVDKHLADLTPLEKKEIEENALSPGFKFGNAPTIEFLLAIVNRGRIEKEDLQNMQKLNIKNRDQLELLIYQFLFFATNYGNRLKLSATA